MILAAEVEAFLNGELVEFSTLHGLPVAPWMVLNRLAHADPDALRRLVRDARSRGDGPATYEPPWAVAERSLTMALLGETLRSGHDVRRVQRQVLVPFELQTIERSRTEPLTVHDVIAGVIDALAEDRRSTES